MSNSGYAIGTLVEMTGTVSILETTADVVGIGTLFSTELSSNAPIVINDEWQELLALNLLSPNLNLVTHKVWEQTATGATAYRVALTNIEGAYGEITTPRGVFGQYSKAVPLGTGGVRGAGWKTAEWRWGFITQEQRELLRVICPGASAEVYVRTRGYDESDAYYWFRGQMIWPTPDVGEDRQTTRRLNFVIKFQALQQLTFPE